MKKMDIAEEYLVQRSHRFVPFGELQEAVWGRVVKKNTVSMTILRINDRLSSHGSRLRIGSTKHGYFIFDKMMIEENTARCEND